VPVASHHGVNHARQRDLVRAEPVRIDVDLVLAHGAADAGHLGDAGHGVQLIADEPVLDRAKVAEGMALALDGVPEHVPDAGGIRAERGNDPGREPLGEQVQALEHPRPRKYRSTESSKMTLIMENPKADEDRTTRTPGKPCRLTVSG